MFDLKDLFEHIIYKAETYKDSTTDTDIVSLSDILGCCIDIQDDLDSIKEIIHKAIENAKRG